MERRSRIDGARFIKPHLRLAESSGRGESRMVIIQKKPKIKSALTVVGEAQFVRALWRRLAKQGLRRDANVRRAAGVGRGVTIAAGEFLTDPADLAQVVNAARASEKKNMEFVLSTEIIDGQPGTPKMEAA